MVVALPTDRHVEVVRAWKVVLIMPEPPSPKLHPRPGPWKEQFAAADERHRPATVPYAELAVTSNFTFLRGGSHPDELVQQAAHLDYRAIAITDTNSLAGVVRAHVAAKDAGIQLLIGCRLILSTGDDDANAADCVLVYPTDLAAYGRLCRLLTVGKRRAVKGECHLTLHDLVAHHEGLLAVLVPPSVIDEHAVNVALGLKQTFDDDRFSIAASVSYQQDDADRLAQVAGLCAYVHAPMVASNDVLYHAAERQPLQDVLTCIREGCTIEAAGFRLEPNAERHLKPAEEMARLFADHPHAIERTAQIAERCGGFSLDQLKYQYPREVVPAGRSAMQHLRELTLTGAARRYPHGLSKKVAAQIEHELALIEELNYPHYFLTVHDIVQFAEARGILCQGRGAAANSAVCYCLGVTAVDPERIDLLFERFVSRERNEPPDIDIDFEHERREEVIQYLYTRYGRERAALTAEVITYRARSAVREVGKALGLSLDAVDRLARHLDGWGREALKSDHFQPLGFSAGDPTTQRLVQLTRELMGFPRHLSQHVGGFVLTDKPLCELVPIENAAMEDRTVIEWDKDDIDALDMMKVDVLGLGMLTCIRKCFDLVAQHHGRELTLASVFRQEPRDDPAVYDMICAADTVGVFQIESRAQMSMLPRLKPRAFYDLVIEVAIVRPGPIQGDMVHPYLRRRDGTEPATYPDETARQVLAKTLGVPLFQEQAMNLAIRCAGFTADEAEQLRKTIQAWRSRDGRIIEFGRRIIKGMLERGYPSEFAERCFEQIKGFGEYGFPESHAASFALLVYVSAWLKHHYPAAFSCALLNSQPMGFYAPSQLVRDAKEHGVTVRPIDVQHSAYDCTLQWSHDDADPRAGRADQTPFDRAGFCEAGPGSQSPALLMPKTHVSPPLRLGLRMVKGLREDEAHRMVDAARNRNALHSIETLWRASGVRVSSLRRVAEADGFRSMGLDRQQALWQILKLRDAPAPLFESTEARQSVTAAADPLPAVPPQRQVTQDYASTGLSLKQHPMSFVRDRLNRMHVTPARELADERRWPHKTPVTVAGMVTIRQRPATAGGVTFISLEDETGHCNLIVRPKVFERCRAAVRTAGVVFARGRVERHGQVVHVNVHSVQDITTMLEGLDARSR
ncbi:MAG: error-prone DNA polymerase, partial [Phycisphaeraceae bacterium]